MKLAAAGEGRTLQDYLTETLEIRLSDDPEIAKAITDLCTLFHSKSTNQDPT